MGFTDLEQCRQAAKAADGVLPLAVEYLTNGIPAPKSNSSSGRSNNTNTNQYSAGANTSAKATTTRWTFPKLTQSQAERVLQCAAMGFNDEGKIRHALSKTNWSTEEALELLLNDDGGLSSSFSSFEASSKSNLSYNALSGSKSNLSHVATMSASNSPRNSSTAVGVQVLPAAVNPNKPNPMSLASHTSPHNPFNAVSSRSGSQSNISYDAFANLATANTVSVFDRPPSNINR